MLIFPNDEFATRCSDSRCSGPTKGPYILDRSLGWITQSHTLNYSLGLLSIRVISDSSYQYYRNQKSLLMLWVSRVKSVFVMGSSLNGVEVNTSCF